MQILSRLTFVDGNQLCSVKSLTTKSKAKDLQSCERQILIDSPVRLNLDLRRRLQPLLALPLQLLPLALPQNLVLDELHDRNLWDKF